jgi:hypothetical protein
LSPASARRWTSAEPEAARGLIVSVPRRRFYFLDGNAEVEWASHSLHSNSASTMKKQIVQVSVLQSAKVMAGIYLVTSIPIGLLMALFMSATSQAGASLAVLIMMPLLYAFFGFLGSLIAAWVYNLVAARIGGFEFTTAEVGAAQH